MKVTDDIPCVGVNDHQADLFEGQYKAPDGMACDSYAIPDGKAAAMDAVDGSFRDGWMKDLVSSLAAPRGRPRPASAPAEISGSTDGVFCENADPFPCVRPVSAVLKPPPRRSR